MTPITKGQRIFYGVICAAALLVAVLGLFSPEYLASIFTWIILPPLHARFVGAIYLFGAVFMAGCLMAKTQAEVRGAVQLIGVWTGILFIISIFWLSLSAFDFKLLPVWIWFISYITYPIISIWMTVRGPQLQQVAPLPGSTLPAWPKGFLLVQGIVVSLLAVFLFLTPVFMSTIWPWTVTPELAQMYSGPLLSYGLGSLIFSRQNTWLGIRAIVPSMFAFTLATVIVSFMHINLFSFAEMADLLWFGWFGIATMILGVLTVRVMQVRA
ncbi:MAG: hypothetical protein H7Y59_09860 [Anaerolineales bacterium]|nr:hypothetical protein [Anaerolineales bacterium]